ncbi:MULTISPECIES: hypothetical protein [Asaia]|uniref:Uncharacterized protein n=2 Tax=Asaia bogorensis TaxID=91915 RepID=A0AAN4U2S8_9PROT|nr:MULTISPECIES: hypothetical protein [Asaia]ETC97839.1 hypothetical protein P792_12830 [Asaia sp. SF2.1]CDG40901.1 hypothetical protein ASAP_2856 [Asaia bogorensis]BAT20732.1 hypothetical protein Asbog_02478 [Asaia bogorensis NBRC 16594]GBQ76098.1 hypothetical protein AA0311_1057 [Asaia bogorensis NBRC 16594]GEL53742.1 hypothetical protein ABO01nite_17490 [Asaia bogorensis NBRC 16594]
MRELNSTEIETVSGAGFFSNFGFQLGSAIGNIVDWSTKAISGKAPVASAVAGASNLGTGIGEIVDSIASNSLTGVPQAVQTTGLGITQIVATAVANAPASKPA